MSQKATFSANVRQAEAILRGESATPQKIFDLAMILKDEEREFGYARRLLGRARRDPGVNDFPQLRTKLRQQQALCTYKDPDLSDQAKFDRALQILADSEDLRTTTDQETLGIAGAIHKYKWQAFAQRQDLEIALHYCMRGYDQGINRDYGYTAINAAFVLDLLADDESGRAAQTGVVVQDPNRRGDKAKKIRQEIVDAAPAMLKETPGLSETWWFQVTIAEAYFGLEEYKEALPSLQAAAALPNIREWEYEATARQLATLARILIRRAAGNEKELIGSEAWNVLESFLGGRAPGVLSAFLGKVGLALSGGGFRASLFHIGVLAKLAEFDVLRHVEVLSCVSGGSIVGAHYYLKIRQLMESTEGNLDRAHYIKVVSDLEKEFLTGVQKNIRTRVVGSLRSNLKMAFVSDYSRTERAGELYEKHLFSETNPGTEQFWLNRLFITPADERNNAKFRPKYDNWRRESKVPILVLNATTLNTGHNWQFTASWMGEPPAETGNNIDANYRLRRMYYSEAPQDYQNIRLGYAVAASACVPGIFDPLSFPDLYPNLTVRLVDGGVHDNQGTSALLEQGCNVLLVSDASGQMGEENEPANSFIGVPLRSNSILQARVRIAEFDDIDARRQSSLLKGLMFLHLKKDLNSETIDWKDCEDPIAASEDAGVVSRGELTSYGVRKEIQRLLASIRTDLDSFNDAEACALMMSGYLMTEHEFPKCLPAFRVPPPIEPPWRFMTLKSLMQRRGGNEDRYDKFKSLLEVARHGAFKIWKLEPVLNFIGRGAVLGAILGLLYVFYLWRESPITTYGAVGMAIVSLAFGVLLGKLLGPRIAKVLTSFGTPKRLHATVSRIVAYLVAGVGLFFLAWIHIWIFDRWYLSRGRLDRVTGEASVPMKKTQ
jgi:predicted acylesterase/phospholipase RssA